MHFEKVANQQCFAFQRCTGHRPGECVDVGSLCDGTYDCQDRYDEAGCDYDHTDDRKRVEAIDKLFYTLKDFWSKESARNFNRSQQLI